MPVNWLYYEEGLVYGWTQLAGNLVLGGAFWGESFFAAAGLTSADCLHDATLSYRYLLHMYCKTHLDTLILTYISSVDVHICAYKPQFKCVQQQYYDWSKAFLQQSYQQ